MVFFEALQALLSLDFTFFIDIFLDNWFLFFGFYALIHFFLEKKNTLFYTIILTIILWAFVDIEHLTGLALISSGFLVIYYVTKIALLAFAEDSPSLKRYMLVLSTLQFYVAFFIYNFVLGGTL